MVEITQQLILGVAKWFIYATLLIPVLGMLWHFAMLLLGERSDDVHYKHD